jgi:hypothetical protein
MANKITFRAYTQAKLIKPTSFNLEWLECTHTTVGRCAQRTVPVFFFADIPARWKTTGAQRENATVNDMFCKLDD